MLKFIAKRLLTGLGLVAALSVLTFSLLQLGNSDTVRVGQQAFTVALAGGRRAGVAYENRDGR